MKTSLLCTVFATILSLSTHEIKAQTIQGKLNQMELLKQFLGVWEGEVSKDTVMILNLTSFGGKAIENNYKVVTKDKIIYSGKEIYGYNQKYDKIVLAAIKDYSALISLMAIWFSSKDTSNLVGYQYLSDPEKSNSKMQWIFIPPDSAKRVVIQNSKVVRVSNFIRHKQ
jgi:hypothetical protein